eukprot:SAG31_NODE_17174_length_680_cov_1.311532_1_plen_23_part_01
MKTNNGINLASLNLINLVVVQLY